ncbi:putative rna family [Phaeomoniella chlamydospora]|uniref:Putative rna family n=1 Tax=Phaeomoniella chlamydospora TaxID=158046 RepID=A0A0G2GNT6_PHACM|nr:putative rna family [Phaeomoniella chlamydospora]
MDRMQEIERLARPAKVRLQYVGLEWAGILNKMAQGRPHNGIVLEASPLPKVAVRALGEVHNMEDPINVKLAHMSEEERAVTGESSVLPREVRANRYPFVLLLDRVLDPGNLGGIARSAYFLGVDAVVVTRSGSAPTSAVTIKASAGALETMALLTAGNPVEFIKKSKVHGWKVFAGVSPSSHSMRHKSDKDFISPASALASRPCILVVGGEGEGVSWQILQHIDGHVGIAQAPRNDGLNIVESLNVSVATALMAQQFLDNSTRPRPNTMRELDSSSISTDDQKLKIF